jgi:hypothetical protein
MSDLLLSIETCICRLEAPPGHDQPPAAGGGWPSLSALSGGGGGCVSRSCSTGGLCTLHCAERLYLRVVFNTVGGKLTLQGRNFPRFFYIIVSCSSLGLP